MARRIEKHATRLSMVHEAAVSAEFAVGQRVMTIDSLPGRIQFVAASFAPGVTEYQVQLDNGMGHGTYTASQLRPISDDYRTGQQVPPGLLPAGVTAAIEAEASEVHVASEDYPEMGSILHDRPDPGQQISVIGRLYEDGEFLPRSPGGPLQRLAVSTYGHPDDPRDEDYNGGPNDTGMYWAEPAQQEWVHEHIGPQEEAPPPVFDSPVLARLAQLEEACQLFGTPRQETVPACRDAGTPLVRRGSSEEDAWQSSPVLPWMAPPRSRKELEDHLWLIHNEAWGERTADPPHDLHEKMHYGLVHDPDHQHDYQNGRDPVFGARHRATTINGTQIDDHGDAPEHGTVPRASEPNAYDSQSTEGNGDPKWDDPVDAKAKEDYNGATVGMYPEGISSGNGPGISVGPVVASVEHPEDLGSHLRRYHGFGEEDLPEEDLDDRDLLEYHHEMEHQLAENNRLDPARVPHDHSDSSDPVSRVHYRPYAIGEDFGPHVPRQSTSSLRLVNPDDDPDRYRPVPGYQPNPNQGIDPLGTVPAHLLEHLRNVHRVPDEQARGEMGQGDLGGWGYHDVLHAADEGYGADWHGGAYPHSIDDLRATPGGTFPAHASRVPWTDEERGHLHRFDTGNGASEGDFVPSTHFTNRMPLSMPPAGPGAEEIDEPAPEVIAGQLRAQGVDWKELHNNLRDFDSADWAPMPRAERSKPAFDTGTPYDREEWDSQATPEEHEHSGPAGHLDHTLSVLHTAQTEDEWEQHLRHAHGWTDDVIEHNRNRGNRLSDIHVGIHELGLADHGHGQDDPRAEAREETLTNMFGEDLGRAQQGRPVSDWIHARPQQGGRAPRDVQQHFDRSEPARYRGPDEWAGVERQRRLSALTAALDPEDIAAHLRSVHGFTPETIAYFQESGKDPAAVHRGLHEAGIPDHTHGPADEYAARMREEFGPEYGVPAGASEEHPEYGGAPGDPAYVMTHNRVAPIRDLDKMRRGDWGQRLNARNGTEAEHDAPSFNEPDEQDAPADPGDPNDLDDPGSPGDPADPDTWPMAGTTINSGGPAYTQGTHDQHGTVFPPPPAPAPPAGADGDGPPGEDGDEEGDGKGKKIQLEISAHLAAFTAAAADPAFRFHFTAAWSDVVAKAKRIRAAGRVRLTSVTAGMVIGEVSGEHDIYESGIQRPPGKPNSIQHWACGCPWASFHQDKSMGTRYAGRPCSHVMAVQFEAQSRQMFGREMQGDPSAEQLGIPHSVVVKSLPPWDQGHWRQYWLAPAASKVPDEFGREYDPYNEDEDAPESGYFPDPWGGHNQNVRRDEPGRKFHRYQDLSELAAESAPWEETEEFREDAEKSRRPPHLSGLDKTAEMFCPACGDDRDDYGRCYNCGTVSRDLRQEHPLPGAINVSSPAQQATAALLAAGENLGDIIALAQLAGLNKRALIHVTADQANAPWGSDDVSKHPPQKPYGATEPPNKDQDPGSYGFLSAPDPANWGGIDEGLATQAPLSNNASLAQPVDQDEQGSFGYADRANAAGPATGMDSGDPQGIRMEESREDAGEYPFPLDEEVPDLASFDFRRYNPPQAPPAPDGRPEGSATYHTHEGPIDPVFGSLGDLRDEPEPALPSTTGEDEIEHTAAADGTIGGGDAGSGEDTQAPADVASLGEWGASIRRLFAGTPMGDLNREISPQAQQPSPVTQQPGMGSMDDSALAPEDPSIQTIGNQQWSGGGADSDEVDVPAGTPQGSLDDIVASFQRSAAAGQYSGGGGAGGKGGGGMSDGDIAAAARQFLLQWSPPPQEASLQKTADVLPEREAAELISEGRGQRARNLGLLQLEGTHYEETDDDLAKRGLSLDDFDDDVLVV